MSKELDELFAHRDFLRAKEIGFTKNSLPAEKRQTKFIPRFPN